MCSNELLGRSGFVVLRVINPCKDATLLGYTPLIFSTDTPQLLANTDQTKDIEDYEALLSYGDYDTEFKAENGYCAPLHAEFRIITYIY